MERGLVIAIDFDDTFTADEYLWTCFIRSAKSLGHKVLCISWRAETMANREDIQNALPSGVKVLLTDRKGKRKFAMDQGYDVDIWIDDMPHAIMADKVNQ